LVALSLWGGLLFWSAGTLVWSRGWIHLGLLVVTLFTNFAVLLWKNPAVIVVRARGHAMEETFDKVIVLGFVPIAFAIPVVAGLDAARYGWTALPFWAVGLGVAIHGLGSALVLWTMVANPFLHKDVRVQSDDGHYVITTGPYALVRHPMYAGFILVLAGIPLVLGSYWTFLPVGAAALLLVIRITYEERMLREQLPGYEQYGRLTRYRLIPRVW
jgi:protein-S-isoprenylcysteine O-methyltransferase Ste14